MAYLELPPRHWAYTSGASLESLKLECMTVVKSFVKPNLARH